MKTYQVSEIQWHRFSLPLIKGDAYPALTGHVFYYEQIGQDEIRAYYHLTMYARDPINIGYYKTIEEAKEACQKTHEEYLVSVGIIEPL